jgi:hypothetical protein
MPANRLDHKEGPTSRLLQRSSGRHHRVTNAKVEGRKPMFTEIHESDPVEQSHEVRDEWIAAVDDLFRDLETWAKANDSTTRRDPEWLE